MRGNSSVLAFILCGVIQYYLRIECGKLEIHVVSPRSTTESNKTRKSSWLAIEKMKWITKKYSTNPKGGEKKERRYKDIGGKREINTKNICLKAIILIITLSINALYRLREIAGTPDGSVS